MKIRFEEKMNNRYMVICPDKTEAGFSAYMYRMILDNRIKGLLPCRTGNMDGRSMLYYNTSSLIQVSDHLREHTADETFLKRFLRELAAITEELQRYLIGSECLILDPEQIFVSAATEDFRFAVCFDDRNSFSENLLKFSEYLIPRLPANNHTAAAMGYELYQSCISGLVTAESLRKTAAGGLNRETAVRQVSEGEEAAEVSEEDIFAPVKKKKKRKRSGSSGSWKEKLHRTVQLIKEKIRTFIHRLSD